MTGEYLAWQIRHRAIGPISAFREYVFHNVVPHFSGLDQRADQIVNEYYEHAVSQPDDEDFDGYLSNFAEDARDHALNWYEMMRSMRQTMLNLLAAGLFHLAEQQLAVLGQDAGFENRQPKSTALGDSVRWYMSTLRVDLHGLSEWPLIDELRLVANTAKHAEGRASADLKTFAPIYSSTQRWPECLQPVGSKIAL
jgi:hypothetical protein